MKCPPVVHAERGAPTMRHLLTLITVLFVGETKLILAIIPVGFTSPSIDALETSVKSVLGFFPAKDISDVPAEHRENLGVARVLKKRLDIFERNRECRRCWLSKANCVCSQCPSLEKFDETLGHTKMPFPVRRIFVLTHHKEIGMAVDTAKVILASFPQTAKLVVGGLVHQQSYVEMLEALNAPQELNRALILFPTDNAMTFAQVEASCTNHIPISNSNTKQRWEDGWDVVVIDGTWSQAGRLHKRLLDATSAVRHVSLSREALGELELISHARRSATTNGSRLSVSGGLQLRRHPVGWKEISTLEALRLLLRDMHVDEAFWAPLSEYQSIADAAARKQLGPIRLRGKRLPPL